MSIVTSRVFQGCRAFLAPAKSATGTSTATAAKAKPKPKPKLKPTPKATSTSATPRPPRGITKEVTVSPVLRDFLGGGVTQASRSEVVKKIWAHIKTNNLQNPTNKREIFCDAKLQALFDGKEKVGFLEIGKLLSPHFPKNV